MAKWEINPNLTYYSSLRLRNFRGFRVRKQIPFAPLTFLLGPNSSGKSSIFDSLLLLSQSDFNPSMTVNQEPNWIGDLVDMGSFKDTVYNHKTELPIEINVEISLPDLRKNKKNIYDSPNIALEFQIRTTRDEPGGRLSVFRLTDLASKQSITINYSKTQLSVKILGERITFDIKDKRPIRDLDYYSFRRYIYEIREYIEKYIDENPEKFFRRKAAWNRIIQNLVVTRSQLISGAERVTSGRGAPRRWYPTGDERSYRRYFPFHLRVPTFSDVEPQMLQNDYDSPYYPRRYRHRLSESLPSILKKLDIASSINPYQLSPYHSAINIEDSVTGITSNLIDVGYGASQVIPILRACMSPSDGPLFVEQPEIHLHPKAQSIVAEVLCETSNYRQVVVETHSVHMINRARILVAEGKLNPEHVIINLVYRKKSGSYVYPMHLLKNGEFASKWPDGFDFFDERYQDTMRLLQLKHLNGKQ